MIHHVLDVGVLQGNHLLEAGRRTNLRRLVKQEQANQGTDQDDRRTIIENQTLEKRRRRVLLLVDAHGANSRPLLLLIQFTAIGRGEVYAALTNQDQATIAGTGYSRQRQAVGTVDNRETLAGITT